ncbi:MAG: hypothetical protein ACK4MD_06430, partial [Demequina sp.]
MSLTDQYVAATLSRTPSSQRAEVEEDLRAAIADALEARLDAGEFAAEPQPASAAEKTVLSEMGDPELLAATYADRPLQLIGPRLYLQWKRLTVLLLSIVLPVIAALIPVGMWLGGEDFGSVIGTTIGGTLNVGVHLVFWVTLVFAVLDRQGARAEDWAEPWTVDNLSESDPDITWAETVVSVVVLAATAIFIVWQQVLPWTTNDAGEALPILNPDLWGFVLPALLVVIAIELVAVIVQQARGRWTMRDWRLGVVLNVAWVTLIAIPV